MIVAVCDLSRAARIDDVELRSDLIRGPKPCLAHQRDDRVAIIGREDRRVAQAQLLERVPDAVIGARLGEMIAAAHVARALFLDNRPVMRVGLIDRGVVGERVADDDDAGAVRKGVDPFGQQFLAGLGRSGGFARLEPVIDEHVRHDVAGEGIIGAVERALDLPFELFEVAGVGGEPHPVGSQSFGVVVLHELFLRAIISEAAV